MPHLRPVFHEPDPERALDGLIAAFAAFWDSDRIVIRRARALAALDAEIAASLRARDELRRGHLRKILGRMEGQQRSAPANTQTSALDILHMLTSSKTFDALLKDGRILADTPPIFRQCPAPPL